MAVNTHVQISKNSGCTSLRMCKRRYFQQGCFHSSWETAKSLNAGLVSCPSINRCVCTTVCRFSSMKSLPTTKLISQYCPPKKQITGQLLCLTTEDLWMSIRLERLATPLYFTGNLHWDREEDVYP
mmetsp:Transcript_4602/g.29179  ORF Transcript_4602/g.29179 Transcript_4602/m.29179 type:complete len:126 (+) Transcript_4602:31-408(+)